MIPRRIPESVDAESPQQVTTPTIVRVLVIAAVAALVWGALYIRSGWIPGVEFGIIVAISLLAVCSPAFGGLSRTGAVLCVVLFGGLLWGQFAARGNQEFPLARWSMYGGRVDTEAVRSFVLIGTTESGKRYRIVPSRLVRPLERTRLNSLLHREIWLLSSGEYSERDEREFRELLDFLMDRYNADSREDPLRFLDVYTSETRLNDFLSGAEMRNFVLRMVAD